jgi:pimeloyl-ACP methyl ester carboxylesterase
MNFFRASGVLLAYRVDGPDDAPAIVMVNSLGTDLRMWDSQVGLLSRDLRVVRYDCRGHGASGVPAGPYTIERLGLDLLALMDTLGIEQAHVCGLSLGGMVALWFAASYPERVARAVFANTAARFLSEAFRRKHPDVAQQMSEMIEATNPRGYIGGCAALRDADLQEILAAIHVPSLILAGELDEATPPWQAQELHGHRGR